MGDPGLQIIAGVIIVGIGIVTAQPWVIGIGASLIVGGVAGTLVDKNIPSIDDVISKGQANVTGTLEYLPIVYGKTRMGIKYVFAWAGDAVSPYADILELIMALCHGEIQAIDEIYFDDKLAVDASGNKQADFLWPGYSSTYVFGFAKVLGTDTQTALPINSPLWTPNHRGRGISYLLSQLYYVPPVLVRIPQFTANIRGKKVYDPRTGTTIYSTNPIVCLRDYLISTRYGPGIPASEIDDTAFISEANFCDELVIVPNGVGGQTTQKRFEINGFLDTARPFKENIEAILSSCRGNLIYQGGKYRPFIRKATTASAFKLNEQNIIGNWRFYLPDIKNRINKMVANWVDPNDQYQADRIEWPLVGQVNQYLLDDNNIELRKEINLLMTTNQYTAEQIAMVMRNESRFGIAISLTAKEEALKLQVGDVVKVTHETPDWVDKEFWVMAMGLSQHSQVILGLLEYNAAVYNLDNQTDIVAPSPTVLPDPDYVPPPTSLVLTPEFYIDSNADGTMHLRIKVTWTASIGSFVVKYETQYKKTSDSLWFSASDAAADQLRSYVQPVEAGVSYDVRIRAVNNINATSAWVQASATANISSDASVPSTPTGLTATPFPLAILLTWNANSERDVRQYEIQRATNSGFTGAVSISIVSSLSYIDEIGGGLTRWYRIRAVRHGGKVSAWTAGVSAATLWIADTDLDPGAPSVPTGLTLATGTIVASDGTVLVYLNISWNANAESDLANYEVQYKRQTDSAWTARIVPAGIISIREIGVVGGVTYEVRMQSTDTTGNRSGWTTTSTIVTANDTGAPAVPTSVSAVVGFELVIVKWTPPVDDDFDVVEVWRSTTNDSATATKIGESRGISHVDDKLSAITYYYWLKSRDTSGNTSAFHATQFAGLSATPLLISSADLVVNTAVITVAAQIANAIITNAHITDLSAAKITAGTIAATLYLAGWNITIDGQNSYILIRDNYGVNRAKIGKLGAGTTDWGLELYNSSGSIIFSANTGLKTAGIEAGAITTVTIAGGAITAPKIAANVVDSSHLRTDVAVISVAAQIANALIQNAHIVNLTVDTLKITGNAIISSITIIQASSNSFNDVQETVMSGAITLANVDGSGGTGVVEIIASIQVSDNNTSGFEVAEAVLARGAINLATARGSIVNPPSGKVSYTSITLTHYETGLAVGPYTYSIKIRNLWNTQWMLFQASSCLSIKQLKK